MSCDLRSGIGISYGEGKRCRKLSRRSISQAAVGPVVVILVPPSADFAPSVPEILKPGRVEAFISEPAMETFNVGVLHGFSGLNVNEFDPPVDSPR